MGNGVYILAKMDLEVEFDAEYDGADWFVENCVESAILGQLGA